MMPKGSPACVAFAFAALSVLSSAAQATPPVVPTWNAAALEEIRRGRLGPPVVARALAIAHTCMYDAWVPYDTRAIAAVATTIARRPAAESSFYNKDKAINYAAYRCLLNLFPAGASRLEAVMRSRSYDPNDTSTDLGTPQGIGNVVAATIIASRRNDGSNQYGDLHPGAYSDTSGYVSRNLPMPFCLPTTPGVCPLNISDPYHWQPLINDRGMTQTFVAPHWQNVTPFALNSATQFDSIPEVSPGPNYLQSPARYQADMAQMLSISGALTLQQKVIVEYWADGPASELPPGHWALFAQYVSQRDANSIDQDVKMFFAMHNASFDAGIVAWHLKRKYDGVRPITGIRNFYQGQPVFAWGGPGQPNQTIDGGKWTPYNPGSNLTPAFPGYVSGHSTFSAASAAVLRAFTGSDNFGFSTVIPPGFGRVEPNVPVVPTTLSYPTFTSAVAEAGISRLYAGIHFSDDNTVGQTVGNLVGQQAWSRAQFLFDGGLGVASTSLSSSPNAATLSWTHTVEPLNNRLLVVGVSNVDAANSVRSVSYGGQPLQRLGSQTSQDNKQRVELWYRVGPAAGTATVVVQMTDWNHVVAGATTYFGVRQQSPFGILRSATDVSTNACVTLANEPAPLVASVLAVKGDAKGVSPGPGQKLRWLGVSNKSGDYYEKFGGKEVIGKGATYEAAPMAGICSPLDRNGRWSMLAVPLKSAFDR